MRQPFRHQIAAWALTAALTLTLQAADGVIEINQAIVEANGGFPYVISEPGSYNLSGNLTVPDENTSAIEVQARDVTLDLNGFAIIGPVQCTAENGSVTCSPEGTGVGVLAPLAFPTVVRNGSVRGMGSGGVVITFGRVEGVRALENGDRGIFLLQSGVVRGCLAELNGEVGIFILDAGAVVEHSIARFNPAGGIVLAAGGVVRGNASDSIFVSNSAVLGNWIENELNVQDSSGYADNVVDGVVTVGQQSQPIGCNLIGGNLVCPEGSAAPAASGP